MTPAGPAAPVPLTAAHDVTLFGCTVPVLDDWLKKRALRNQAAAASRTYVVCTGNTVVGYYTLATGALARDAASVALRRNTPEPIPVIVLGRLAIDRRYQN